VPIPPSLSGRQIERLTPAIIFSRGMSRAAAREAVSRQYGYLTAAEVVQVVDAGRAAATAASNLERRQEARYRAQVQRLVAGGATHIVVDAVAVFTRPSPYPGGPDVEHAITIRMAFAPDTPGRDIRSAIEAAARDVAARYPGSTFTLDYRAIL
jgi:hypothetical protein